MTSADPLAPADPLQALPPPERVNYATGVLLDSQDFVDEQTYHRSRLAAALKAVDGFGTLSGLRVVPPAEGDAELELSVSPGLAVDRFGRLIQIDAPQCIRLARWFAATSTPLLRAAIPTPGNLVADVFLSARCCARGKTQAFASGLAQGLDAVTPARLAEQPQLDLVLRAEASPTPAPKNFWPAPTADAATRLQAVLGSWEAPDANDAQGGLDPLQEHVIGQDTSATLLARVAIPVNVGNGADDRPALDLARRVSVDNSLRPFIFMPGKWLGRAFDATPLVQP
ncbi:hypothetical protein AWB81_05387 [Caballeronia arationis]|uniref:hypothetical protein n=1 Tax=Caballeronia arationis TaxID=1777142 RepID=UPI00074BFAC4|nr:hypothetical protein [Caballeronia arationis]SAK96407.1 hypothetical protein AWB81_05387 [Caballeronia arationis]